jgi:Predicted eukaryotic-type DNA primase
MERNDAPGDTRSHDAPQRRASRAPVKQGRATVSEQLEAIERSGGDGTLHLGRDKAIEVSSLDKVFFPAEGFTKGDVMRYYALMSPTILRTVADRPLVLKRSPDGLAGGTFFQQKPPARMPSAVRVELVASGPDANGGARPQKRIVGGDLPTLLYTMQLGCISVDPWLSRVGSIDDADYAILDLDPGPEAPFGRVVEAALLVHEELQRLGLRAALKTSGSRGLHIAIPLPTGTAYDVAVGLAQSVATRVAESHPRTATVVRTLEERPRAAVYVDYLQNAKGKSVAGVYCVRAKPGATVSTPLDWAELRESLDPHSFTIHTVPARLRRIGDIWGAAMRRRNSRRAIGVATTRD